MIGPKNRQSFSRNERSGIGDGRAIAPDCVFGSSLDIRVFVFEAGYDASVSQGSIERRNSDTDSSRASARFLTIGRATTIYVGLRLLAGTGVFLRRYDRYFIFARRVALRSKRSVLDRDGFVGQDAYT